MSAFLQFNCPTQNKTVKKAMQTYVDFLEKAFIQYWNLWEDYTKLQENHKLCNTRPSSEVTPNCIKKEEPTSQEQLNNLTTFESEDIPMLELKSLDINFDTDIESDSTNLSGSLDKDMNNDSWPTSPVFSRKYLKAKNASASKLTPSPKTTSKCSNSESNAKTHHSIEKSPLTCNQKSQISTTHHVEVTFLPNGKKLKQSRLVFQPIKCNENVLLTDIDKHELTNRVQKAERNSTVDISAKEYTITEKNIRKADETFSEDIIEVSPTQIDVKPKVNRLKLKRKNARQQTVKDFPNKNKYNFNDTTNVIDLTLCSSPKYTSTQKENNEFSTSNTNTFTTLKDKININNLLPMTSEQRKIDIKIKNPFDDQKEDQVMINETQNIVENAKDSQLIKEPARINDLDADETFYLPAEKFRKKNDVNNTENEVPVKGILLNEFNVLPERKEDVPEQVNMRCKTDRAKLNGWDCWECEKYYNDLPLSDEELQKRKNQCSRHRYKYKRPSTPEGFWDPEFPETISCSLRQHTK